MNHDIYGYLKNIISLFKGERDVNWDVQLRMMLIVERVVASSTMKRFRTNIEFTNVSLYENDTIKINNRLVAASLDTMILRREQDYYSQ